MSVGIVHLKDVCEVTDGTHYTPPNSGGSFPFLTVKDMSQNGLDFKECSYVTDNEFDKARSVGACPKSGDVLFSKDGTVGKVHVVSSERPFAVLSSIAILRPDHARLDSRFLGYALCNSSILRGATDRKTGSALQRIILGDLKEVTIPLPDMSKQRRIVGLLEKVDQLRRTRRYTLELSDSFLPAAYFELFGRANPQSTSWPEVGLSELCEHEDDIRCGPFGTQLNRSEFQRTGVPIWGIKHVNTGFQLETDEFVTKSKFLELGAYSLLPGDLVMTRKGTIGNCALYPMHFPPGIMHSDLLRIRLKAGAVSSVFLNYQLHYSSWIKHQIDLISGGAVMAGINVGMLKSIRIQSPPMELQQHFSLLVSKHEHLRATQREALRQAEHLFQTLLHQAFSECMTC